MTKGNSTLTQERLKEVLHYNPITGIFTLIISTSNRMKIGSTAGTKHGNGYLKIGVDGIRYYSHRLALLYMTGELPSNETDHINGIRHDNRFANLRKVSCPDNSKNHCIPSNNTSGIIGVSWDNGRDKWNAYINNINLGYFTSIEDAIEIRKQAEIEYGFHKNHGRER